MKENTTPPGQTDRHTGTGAGDGHPRLLDDLETTRRQIWRACAGQAVLRFGLILMGITALLALADWMWVLPAPVRGSILFGAFVLAILGLICSWPRIEQRHVALAVEREFTELGQRVQTALEYAHPGPQTVPASPGLVRALLDETDERTSALDYQRVIPWAG